MRKPYLVRPVIPKMLKKKYGSWTSYCIHCGSEVTKEALFKEDGITVIEKYCDE